MKKDLIKKYIETADLHALLLEEGLKIIDSLTLKTHTHFKELDGNSILVIDGAILRFSKLQDLIGTKIFPFILETLGEFDPITYIDKLHRLEKREYLSDAQWWRGLRELRNAVTHEYIDEAKNLMEHFALFIKKGNELVEYWKVLEKKIIILLK